MPHRSLIHRRLAAPALLLSLALATAACGGSTDGGGGGGGGGQSAGTTAPKGVAKQDRVIADPSPPKRGGNLVFGLEAETDGLNPTGNRWAISGTVVGLAVYDPLAAYDADIKVKPYLAQSFTPSADNRQWTIKLRPGVTFHNGTPLKSAAIKALFEAHLASGLTKPVFAPVESIETPDDLTVVVKMRSPWVAFPTALTSQAGVVPEPSTLTADGKTPIGTGPFKQVEWQTGRRWVGERFTGYWREGLPYLDGVEFRPIPEQSARTQGLESGELSMMHTTDPEAILKFRDLADQVKAQIVEDRGEGEEAFLLINNQRPPFDDPEMRRALAYATDVEGYNETLDEGVPEIAYGVFNPRSAWYVETPEYPRFDLAEATELVDKYKASHGGQAPKVDLGVGQDNADNGAFLQETWRQAGFDVEVRTLAQSTFIIEAVGGKYAVNLWRQFGAPDPDFDYIWWASENAGDGIDGGLALNIARHKDPCTDAALKKGRESSDLAARKQAYADLQHCFAKDVPYVWLSHTVWAIVANTKVRGITNGPLPDGSPSLPIGGAGTFGGVTRLTQTWLAS